MAKHIMMRIDTGADCEQYIYQVPGDGNAKARPRFRTEAERVEHRRKIAWRDHARKVNENFREYELYSVLTFDDAHEIHTFEEARRVRDNYYRRLLRSKGISQEVIRAKWGQGLVRTETIPGTADRAAPVDFDKSGLTVTYRGRVCPRSPEAWREVRSWN